MPGKGHKDVFYLLKHTAIIIYTVQKFDVKFFMLMHIYLWAHL